MAMQTPSPDLGGERNEKVFDQERANKWTDATIPLSGATFYFSGSGNLVHGPLQYGKLYSLVSKNACHVIAGATSNLTASTATQYWPADAPIFHIPVSGSSEYVAVQNNTSGTLVQAWISVFERTDG